MSDIAATPVACPMEHLIFEKAIIILSTTLTEPICDRVDKNLGTETIDSSLVV